MNPPTSIFDRQRPDQRPLPAGPSPTDRTGEDTYARSESPSSASSPVRQTLPDQLAARRRANLVRADEQAVTCQLSLAHGDPEADEPDSGDFLRQQLPAAYQRDVKRVRVYGLCAKRAFRAEQARLRSLAPVTPPDDLPPIAA